VLAYLPKHFEYVFQLIHDQKRRPVLAGIESVGSAVLRDRMHHGDRGQPSPDSNHGNGER
jgi:hypothetical protein